MNEEIKIERAVLDKIHEQIHQYEHLLTEATQKLGLMATCERVLRKALSSQLTPGQQVVVDLDSSQKVEQLVNDDGTFVKQIVVSLDSNGVIQLGNPQE